MEAIGEADDHAFTTEYAGKSDIMADQLDSGQYDNVSELLQYENPTEFVMALQSFFSGSNQLLNILKKHIPVPEGYDVNSFYNWPEDYQAEYDNIGVDLEALYNELIEVIVTPVQDAQDMFDDFPYLTRLYSRVPLAAMDRDPIFDFQDNGDVSNVHKATFHMTCTKEGKTFYMTLENGEKFVPNGMPGWWDLNEDENLYDAGTVNVEELPAADTIVIYAPGQEPRRINPDDAAYVDDQLQTTPAEDVDVPKFIESDNQETPTLTEAEATSDGSGCASSTFHSTLPWMGLLLLALAIIRRRQEA
jgi:uncharacterized protein (TIGR03382 family)